MKSGTSLLRKLISLSPSVFGGLETHWFRPEFRVQESLRKLATFFDINLDIVHQIARDTASDEAFLDRLMAHCSRAEGKRRWVEKTPDNILHAKRIWAFWPNATLIRLRRDPRDVFASWKVNKGTPVESFLQNAEKERLAAAQLAQDPRFFEVPYEDLVQDPQGTLNDVFALFSEPEVPDVAEFRGDDQDAKRILTATGKSSATAEALKEPVFNSSVGRWAEVLTSEEARLIERRLDVQTSCC